MAADEGERGPVDDPGWETRDSGSVPLPPSRRRERVSEVSTGELRRSEVQAKVDAVRASMYHAAWLDEQGIDNVKEMSGVKA